MASPIGTAEAAIIAAALAFASNIIPWIGKLLGKRKLARQRLTLQTIREDADRLDNSYKRLEAENARLWNRVNSLETALAMERDLHEKERLEHEATRRICGKHERLLRQLGYGDRLDENGEPR